MAMPIIKKIVGNVTKWKLFHEYMVNMSLLTWKTALNSTNFIYIYDFSEVMVKYDFSQYI